MAKEHSGPPSVERETRSSSDATVADSLGAALAHGPVVLDGATGTELERRGVPCELPLWSTHALLDAPEQVEEVHRDYAQAGADILTANTFRTQRYTLARVGLGQRAGELTQRAVRLARNGAEGSTSRGVSMGSAARSASTGSAARSASMGSASGRVWIAGSAAPLEDCYRPDLVPDDTTLQREHAAHCDALAAAGVDLILLETLGSVREGRAAAAAAHASGLPFLVSFVCSARDRLLSGEPLAAALEAIAPAEPLAVLGNCIAPDLALPVLEQLSRSGFPCGVYPNLGTPGARPTEARSDERSPAELASLARGWIRAGASLIGGCCGTRPEHVGALAAVAREAPR